MSQPDCRWARRRGGAALLATLFIVIALMIVVLSTAQTALNAEMAARNERDRHIAFQAAEAALLDAERDIEGGADPASKRAALFADASALGFADDCGRGSRNANLGLCARAAGALAPAWQRSALHEDGGSDAGTVAYGTFTGARMPVGSAVLPARLPRYIIELIPLARAGEDAGQRGGNFYRITAIGFGPRDTTQVVLQSFYRKVAASSAGLR